jgi:deazaflavin-dependent oxidoreductase (nitroreductase family)
MQSISFHPPDVRVIRALYAIGLGPLVGKLILLLTTTGRRTGLPRVTALQYEEVNGAILLGSSRGLQADWVRNLIAHPEVHVCVRSRRFSGRAEVTSDPGRIADFLALRLQRHPRIVGKIMEMQGLPACPTREQLLDYATHLALVIVRPVDRTSHPG